MNKLLNMEVKHLRKISPSAYWVQTDKRLKEIARILKNECDKVENTAATLQFTLENNQGEFAIDIHKNGLIFTFAKPECVSVEFYTHIGYNMAQQGYTCLVFSPSLFVYCTQAVIEQLLEA